MTDLSDESLPEWTAEELLVLRSADDDVPPARSLSATLAAIGAGGAVASGAAAAKGASVAAGMGSTTAKWASVVAASKWLGALALSGVIVTGSVVALRRAEAERRKATAVPAEPAPVRQNAPVAVPAAPSEPFVVETASSAPEAREPSAIASGRAVVRSQPDISLEIAALDAARTALRQGRTSEALAALDRYDAAFARGGSLRVEATALRIESLLRSGKRARATSLASTFLAQNPKSPYAARVRALVEKAPAAP